MDFETYAKSKQTKFILETDRVKLLYEKVNKPDKNYKVIHIAGTNGKGSVSAFILNGLIKKGEKVGLFSSPELFLINDTISVNGVSISDAELKSIYDYLAPYCDEVFNQTGKSLSQFEINFIASLLHFKNKNCTYVIIECGMGGKNDATNVISDSLVSVITKISYDHTGYLGSTLKEIAQNKCGIFKDSSVIFTTNQEKEVMDTILSKVGTRTLIKSDIPKETAFYKNREIINYKDINNVTLSLSGIFQLQNASLAYEVLNYLGCTTDDIKYAFENTIHKARFEEIEENIYFDGAHNVDGVESLVNSINRYFPYEEKIFIIGSMSDKDYVKSLNKLKDLKGQNFKIYTVNVHSNQRSESADVLLKCATDSGYSAKSFDNINDAVLEAKKENKLIIIFGSLYMYKEYKGGVL